MKANGLRGDILNDYGWGAYLVWHVAPDSKVFIDGRCELVYPDYLIRKYFYFLNGQPGGRSVLDEYPHDLVLVAPRSGACGIVAKDSRWKLIYRDEVSALFAKVSGHGGDLVLKTANGEARPAFFP